jgi:hypothetical protein
VGKKEVKKEKKKKCGGVRTREKVRKENWEFGNIERGIVVK